MVEADLVRKFLPVLQFYHFAISMVGSLTVVAAVQHLGQATEKQEIPMKLRRASLGVLSVALFCSGIRMPVIAAPIPLALLSAAAVNTAVLLIMIPIALPDWREVVPWRKVRGDRES